MKKFKEKYSLLLAIIVCFALYVLLSWFVPTGSVSSSTYTAGGTSPVGFFGLFYYQGVTIGTFVQFGLIILSIGAFYGTMAKTGVYGKIVNKIASRYENHKKMFLVLTVVLTTLVSSLTGLPYAMMIVVPLLLAV